MDHPSGFSDVSQESLRGASLPINYEEAEKEIEQLKIAIESRLRSIRNEKLDEVSKEAKDELVKQDEKRRAISEPVSAYKKRIMAREQTILRHIFGISAAIVFVASVGFSLFAAITLDTVTLEKVVQIAKDIALPFVSVVLGFYFGATAKS